MPKFFQNEEFTYIKNKYVEENSFIGKKAKIVDLPEYNDIKSKLPVPIWAGHESVVNCYYKAWEIAISNISNPKEGSWFVSPFIDAAFNNCIFMWDSCFMLMFGKYAHNIFCFQETLDNFYSHQHKDGFISREIDEKDGSEKFTRFDPASTGPNVLPWCEYEYFMLTGDRDRLEKVFPVLLSYHHWLRQYRTWRDGSYWSSGFGCGMDNSPRLRNSSTNDKRYYSNGHMVWVDACMQQVLSCNVLLKMAEICKRSDDVKDIAEERNMLMKFINEKLWDETTEFYYDLWDNGKLNMVKTIGSYWGLLAQVVPEEKIDCFVQHLQNENEFKRPNRIPTLSADNEHYSEKGNYWCGSVWAPTNYMVLKGLSKYGYHKLAYEIAEVSVENVVNTFKETGTIWENYSPELTGKGSIAKPDFVGWSGLFPISILFEYVFGINVDVENRKIRWNIFLTDDFGVKQLPFGNYGLVDLECKKRGSVEEKPDIVVNSNVDFTLKIFWNNNNETIEVKTSDFRRN